MIEVINKQSNVLLEIKEQSKYQGSHDISENQKNNMLEDAPTIQISFKDQRINAVEKIDQRDLVMSNKPSLISHIEFVIPDEFKDVKIKVILFTKMVKELVQVCMVQILILQLFRIQGQVLSSWNDMM